MQAGVLTTDPNTLWVLLIALLVLAVGLGVVLVTLVSRLDVARSGRSLLERELESARRELFLLQQDQQLQTRFIMEFLELSKRLDSLASSRTIPAVLLQMITNTFEPVSALVLLQKPGDGPRRLTAVGIYPEVAAIKMGMDFPSHEGELGLVVRAKRVMSREDFLQATYQNAIVGRKQSLPGFPITLAAPMVFKDTVYGVLCVSRPHRRPAASREVLGLIAQLGALTYHNSAAYNRIKKTSELDELTQVANKASIRDALEKEIVRAQRTGYRTSILLFDIDNFKNYNDVNGHLAGDELLRDLARIISQATRDYDILGRFGGEEFLLILPETESAGAAQVAEKVRILIAREPFAFATNQPLGCVSISGGVATFPENGRDGETLLRLADEALYVAKAEGRNRVVRARALAIQTQLPAQPVSPPHAVES